MGCAALPAIAEGVPAFERAHGQSLGEYLRTCEEFRSGLQHVMNAGNAFLDKVPVRFDFSSVRTVVDVAGGAGDLLASVLRRYPGIRGVLLDLPHVLP
ncbi:methyltransferase [Saccharopolyspora sp. NPDC050642]|uniref:methyltransferase n=1 Tax=Saccharopolyspora sp. NPDC050642 TaxID=3157099 RepID=UPI0033D7268C